MEKCIRRFSLILAVVSAAGLIIMMVLTVADVVGRHIGKPLGVDEVVSLSLGLTVLCGMSYTTAQRRHVRLELIRLPFSPFMDILADSLSMAVFSLMSWRAIVLVIRVYRQGETTDNFGIPVFPIALLVFIAAFGIFLELCIQLYHDISQVTKRK